jgi:hypothetical protein
MKGVFIYLGLCSTSLLNCQYINKLTIEADFGANLSIPYNTKVEVFENMETHPVIKYSSGISYAFSMNVGYEISSRYDASIGCELNRTTLGYISNSGLLTEQGNISSNYLLLLLKIKYKFVKLPCSFSISPYIGFLIDAKDKGISTIDTSQVYLADPNDPAFQNYQPYNYDRDINNNYRKIDVGISSQIDYNFKISSWLSGHVFTKLNSGLINIISFDAYIWKKYNLIFGVGLKI